MKILAMNTLRLVLGAIFDDHFPYWKHPRIAAVRNVCLATLFVLVLLLAIQGFFQGAPALPPGLRDCSDAASLPILC